MTPLELDDRAVLAAVAEEPHDVVTAAVRHAICLARKSPSSPACRSWGVEPDVRVQHGVEREHHVNPARDLVRRRSCPRTSPRAARRTWGSAGRPGWGTGPGPWRCRSGESEPAFMGLATAIGPAPGNRELLVHLLVSRPLDRLLPAEQAVVVGAGDRGEAAPQPHALDGRDRIALAEHQPGRPQTLRGTRPGRRRAGGRLVHRCCSSRSLRVVTSPSTADVLPASGGSGPANSCAVSVYVALALLASLGYSTSYLTTQSGRS